MFSIAVLKHAILTSLQPSGSILRPHWFYYWQAHGSRHTTIMKLYSKYIDKIVLFENNSMIVTVFFDSYKNTISTQCRAWASQVIQVLCKFMKIICNHFETIVDLLCPLVQAGGKHSRIMLDPPWSKIYGQRNNNKNNNRQLGRNRGYLSLD